MSRPDRSGASILVASDNVSDAQLIKKLLEPEFFNVLLSTHADNEVSDFEQQRPDVLVLAFSKLIDSERYYLGLFRTSERIHERPHRTVVLCHKDEVHRAYKLCRQNLFDDYILFWPMTHDSPRLLMAVHNAMRELEAAQSKEPTAAEFAAEARRMGALKSALETKIADGAARVESVAKALQDSRGKLYSAIDGFSARLAQGPLAQEALVQEVSEFRRAAEPHLQSLSASIVPVQEWGETFELDLEPHLDSIEKLTDMAEQIRLQVLVVDDDPFQHELIGNMLSRLGCDSMFAEGGVAALNVLRKMRPDLILMDVLMPGMSGIETTQRLKATPHLARIPVIMVTGNSEGRTVVDSLRAGACDFVVKPVEQDILQKKIAAVLSLKQPAEVMHTGTAK